MCVYDDVFLWKATDARNVSFFFVRGMPGADDCVKVLVEFQFLFSSSPS